MITLNNKKKDWIRKHHKIIRELKTMADICYNSKALGLALVWVLPMVP